MTPIVRLTLFAWLVVPRCSVAQSPAGTTDFNVADRLAIQNVISSQCLELDGFRLDAWVANYAADALFVVINSGKRYEFDRPVFEKFFRDRFRKFKENGDQRRHVVSNILFLSESAANAHVRANGVLLTTSRGGAPVMVTCLAYEGWFVKRDGVWLIRRWIVCGDTDQDFTDANLPERVRICDEPDH